jgi:sugar transferase (PEP-CTERM/EpsH1 system associated)
MKSLRILHVSYSLDVGGLERVVINLAKGLKGEGHLVKICCLNGKGVLGEEVEEAGIEVFSLKKKPGIVWNLPYRISKIIVENNIEVVHTHNEAGLIYGATASILSRVPEIVHTEHGKEPGYDKKKVLEFAEGLLLRKVNHVVAVSKDAKNKILKLSGIDKDKVLVIPNGIDVENYFRPESRKEKRNLLGIGPESFVIGNIGRLVPLKNQEFLMDIFSKLSEEFPNLKLVIVGDGPIRGALERYSSEHGMNDSVLFLGERKDIAELLSTFDLFVLPSLTEGVSLTLLEAMAAGKAIVASAVGGNPEVIEDEKTGLLIPVNEKQQWIEAIRMLIRNDDKRRSISEMAMAEVNERFSLQKMVEDYEKIYYA